MKRGSDKQYGANGGREGNVDGEHHDGGGQHSTSNIQHPTSKDQNGRSFDLEERLLTYAVRVVRAVDGLAKSRGSDHLGGQLLRSGTSPALNHGEAQAAESLADFIHKMKICLKELRESRRTLKIIQAVPLTNGEKSAQEISSLIGETEELIRIFYTGIRTASTRRDPRNDGSSSRVREDAPNFNVSPSASINDQVPTERDPITGAEPWMLDVECWMLDVERGASTSDPGKSPISREGAPQ